jgi:hypothetical protein
MNKDLFVVYAWPSEVMMSFFLHEARYRDLAPA